MDRVSGYLHVRDEVMYHHLSTYVVKLTKDAGGVGGLGKKTLAEVTDHLLGEVRLLYSVGFLFNI